MPRLPVVAGREVVKALRALGFEQVRQRGSHVIMRRGQLGCAVPMHRMVKTGTLATILKQAEVTVEEFRKALER